MAVESIKRIFRMSSLELADPAPDLPAEEAIKFYAGSYPQLQVAQLSEPKVEKGVMVYEIVKNEVKTKG